MKSKLPIVLLLVAAVVAVVVVRKRAAAQTHDGSLRLYGNVDVREVELAFRQPGRLATMALEEGSTVGAGDFVAALDDQPYREAVAVAEAELQAAEAERDKLRDGFRPQDIAQAEIAVTRARAVLARADLDLQRQTELARAGAAGEKTLESARLAQQEATAALAAAEQTLSLQREGFRNEDRAVATARVAAAQAVLTQRRTALSDTRLQAPSDGVIHTRLREPGSMVGVREPVYVLALREPVFVRAYVAEPDLARVTPGTAVAVRIDGSDETFEGKVGFVSPRAEFTPKSVETADLRTDLVYRLRIIMGSGDARLHQGMPVTIEVAADPADASAEKQAAL